MIEHNEKMAGIFRKMASTVAMDGTLAHHQNLRSSLKELEDMATGQGELLRQATGEMISLTDYFVGCCHHLGEELGTDRFFQVLDYDKHSYHIRLFHALRRGM